MPDKKPSKDEIILERLDRMEAQLQTLVKAQQSLAELKSDLSPLMNSAFKIMIDELGMVESGFQLEDFWDLLKRGLRSVRNITYVLEQMENIIDLWNSIEPLMKSAVHGMIRHSFLKS